MNKKSYFSSLHMSNEKLKEPKSIEVTPKTPETL